MEILEHFKRIISKATYPFVLEFGVCDGYHSNLMIEALKQTEKPFIYHGFEPNKELHEQILNNLKGHLMFNPGLISIFPHAIGRFNEELPFYKSYGQKIEGGKVVDNYYGSSSIRRPKLVKQSYPQMQFVEERVITKSLDRHIEQQKLEGFPIDFIWADIQGAEVDLITGGRETFRIVKYFYTEYENAESYEGQIGLEGILELLPDFEIVEDYGGDVLLKNKLFTE